MSKLKVGNPLEEDVDIVPLISTKSADYVSELIEDAKNKGADLNLIYQSKYEKPCIF